jgi:hypothetical protein
MTKLNSLAWARVIGPEGGAENGAVGAGVEEGTTRVDVLVVSSSASLHNLVSFNIEHTICSRVRCITKKNTID